MSRSLGTVNFYGPNGELVQSGRVDEDGSTIVHSDGTKHTNVSFWLRNTGRDSDSASISYDSDVADEGDGGADMRDIVISEADAESRPAVAQEAAGASEPRTVDALALPRWDHAAQELLLLNQKAPKLASIRRRAAAAATAAVDATAAAISEAVAAAQDSDAPIVVRQTMPDDPAVAAAVTASEPTRDAARLLELVPAADREFAARPDLARKVALWTGDVTRLRIECVVNATNPTLSPGGGGLNSTLHMRAGADMAQELQHVVGAEQLQPGDVVRTGGHGLPCRAVLHVLPPRFGQPDTDVTLGECCTAVLQAAVRFGFREIALPCLGTGHYGHPADLAAVQSLGAVRVWLEENSELVDLLVLCTRTPDNHVLYEQLMPVYFPTVPPIDVSDASAGASRRSGTVLTRPPTASASGDALPAAAMATDAASAGSEAADAQAADSDSAADAGAAERVAALLPSPPTS